MTDKELSKKLNQLRKQNKLYREILDRVTQGVYVINAERKIVWYNKMMERIDGIEREKAIGKAEEEVWSNINFNEGVVTNTLKTQKKSAEKMLPYKTKTGRKINASMQAFPVCDKNNLEYVYLVINYLDYLKKMLDRKKIYDSKVKIFNDTMYTFDSIIGKSRAIINAMQTAKMVAPKQSSVFLHGETGTGKELFAQSIHNASPNKRGQYVAINCAAIPENLMESTLFGSVKGAYTGAVDKPGLLEEAQNGTLFLDELDSLSLPMQSKLLRVLQDKAVRRVGDNRSYQINCRIISATNKSLRELLDNNTVRQDLFFRLAVVTLKVPSLAERREDIEDLVNYFISIYNEEFDLKINSVDEAVLKIFHDYSWPGNVRELENAIENMMNFVTPQSNCLSIHELPPIIMEYYNKESKNTGLESYNNIYNDSNSLHEALTKFEIQYLNNALEEAQWNITQAAKNLKIHREALYYRIKKYSLR